VLPTGFMRQSGDMQGGLGRRYEQLFASGWHHCVTSSSTHNPLTPPPPPPPPPTRQERSSARFHGIGYQRLVVCGLLIPRREPVARDTAIVPLEQGCRAATRPGDCREAGGVGGVGTARHPCVPGHAIFLPPRRVLGLHPSGVEFLCRISSTLGRQLQPPALCHRRRPARPPSSVALGSPQPYSSRPGVSWACIRRASSF
jgi:hypothetical protein